MTTKPKITEQMIHGVRVVTTEIETADGIISTSEGLIEALDAPFQNLTPEKKSEQRHKEHLEFVAAHKTLIEQFVN